MAPTTVTLVNGQTAWSLARKAERFDIRIVTALESSATEKMRLNKIEDLQLINNATDGYIIPNGAKFLIIDKITG